MLVRLEASKTIALFMIMLNSFVVVGCFWAGRSVWNDRDVGIVEVAGSNPAPSTITSFLRPLGQFTCLLLGYNGFNRSVAFCKVFHTSLKCLSPILVFF